MLVHLLIQPVQDHQGVVSATDVELFGKSIQRGRRCGKLTRQQHLPVVALLHHGVQLRPRARRQKGRDWCCRLHLDQRLGNDHKLPMHSRNIEVVHVVREMIAIAEDPATGAHREVKGHTALIEITSRMHPRLHHAFADPGAVQKFRQMANRIVHSRSS